MIITQWDVTNYVLALDPTSPHYLPFVLRKFTSDKTISFRVGWKVAELLSWLQSDETTGLLIVTSNDLPVDVVAVEWDEARCIKWPSRFAISEHVN